MALYGKLALLLVKQLSKPLASRIKLYAAEHSTTRAALVTMAQGMHKTHMSVTEALRPEGSPRTFAGALSEEKALKQVTEFLGEAVVFGVAGAVVWYEVRRQSAKDAAKEHAKEERRAHKEEERERIRVQMEQRITSLEHTLGELLGRVEQIDTQRPNRRRSAWFGL